MKGKHVLIVEDEADIRELIRLYLQKQGYAVTEAGSGEQALLKVEQLSPDAILLDIQMTGIDGFEFCRLTRLKLSVPIIFLSSRKAIEDKLQCFELGGDDYITKPFDFRELTARLEAHIRRYTALSPQTEMNMAIKSDRLCADDFVIDLQRHLVWVREREIRLPAKEWGLLALLATHPNQVWSAERLYERVWGLEAAGNSETVRVHIRYLRRKLEPDPDNPLYIVTVRGFGYMFRGDLTYETY